MEQGPVGYFAECFWPDVNASDLAALDQCAQARAAELSRQSA